MSHSFVVLNMKRFEESKKIEVKLLIEQKEHIYTITHGGIFGGIQVPAKLEHIADQPVERGRKLTELIFRFLEDEKLEFPIDLTDSSSWKPKEIDE